MDKKELELMVKEGEGLTIEFKEKYTPRIAEDIVSFSNTRGGFILLGVNDQGKVIGDKLTGRMKADINCLARSCDPHISITNISQVGNAIIIEISEGEEKPYSCSAGYFRRLDAVSQKMSQKELRIIFRETADRTYEDIPRRDFSTDDVSLKKVKAFLKETNTSYNVSKGNLTSVLASISIYKEGKINNAGILMFAENINKYIPHSETILGAFKGTNKTHIYDRKDVRDDVLTQFNESISFLQKHLNIRSEIRGVNRYDIYEIPLDALREAVVNAIIHRDYSMRGTNISINVFDDRVEIVNPGGLPSGITSKNFGKESMRRNLIIADLFHRMGKVERLGSGIGKMRKLMKQSGLKEPVFESDTFFRAIFYRNPEYALKRVPELPGKSIQKTSRKHPENIQKIIDVISENPNISMRALMQKLNLTEGSIRHHLFSLKKKGILKRIGPDKGGHWEIL